MALWPDIFLICVAVALPISMLICRYIEPKPSCSDSTEPTDRKVSKGSTDKRRWPADVTAFFKQTAGTLDELGFHEVETVHTDADDSTFTRQYVHKTDDVLAEVTLTTADAQGTDNPREKRIVTFVSVFDDGITMHTSNIDFRDATPPSRSRILFRCLPHLPIADLYDEHRTLIQMYIYDHDANVLRHVQQVLHRRLEAEELPTPAPVRRNIYTIQCPTV